MAKIKKIDNKKCWWGYGEIAAENVNGAATLESSLTVFKKFNVYLSYDSAVPVVVIEVKIHRKSEFVSTQRLVCEYS